MQGPDFVFVGFAKHVVALDRATGKLMWEWEAPKGRQYPAVLFDRDKLFVSLMGYTYCLDPWTGHVLWENELSGMGTGVATMAAAGGSTGSAQAAAAIAAQQAAAAASGG